MVDCKKLGFSSNQKKNKKPTFHIEDKITSPNSNSKQLSSNEIFLIKKIRGEHLRKKSITFTKTFSRKFLKKIKNLQFKNYKVKVEKIAQFKKILTNSLKTLLLGEDSSNNKDVLEETLNKDEELNKFLKCQVIDLINHCFVKEKEIKGDLYSKYRKQYIEEIEKYEKKKKIILKRFMKNINIDELEKKQRNKKPIFKIERSNNNKTILHKSNNKNDKIINDEQIKNDFTNKKTNSYLLKKNLNVNNPSFSSEFNNRKDQINDHFEFEPSINSEFEDKDSQFVNDPLRFINRQSSFKSDQLPSISNFSNISNKESFTEFISFQNINGFQI